MVSYVKPDQRAELRFPKVTLHFDSVTDAIHRWRMLPADDKAHAVLACESGDVYQPPEMPSLTLRRR
jgi:hypothetical protein